MGAVVECVASGVPAGWGAPLYAKLDSELAAAMMSIAMINRLLPSDIGISVSYPLPGTLFYEKVKQEMKEKQNWTDSDDLALMFRNRYQPPFYKQLHRYVHKVYRKHLALDSLDHLLRAPLSVNKALFRKAASLLYYAPAASLEKWKLHQLEKA